MHYVIKLQKGGVKRNGKGESIRVSEGVRDNQDKQNQHGDRNAERKVAKERGGTER